MLRDELIGTIRRAAAIGQGALHTGMAYRTTLAGARSLIMQQLAGPLGPSALFRIHAANDPDHLAIVSYESASHDTLASLPEPRRMTYAQADERIDRLAAGLRARGLGKGDAAVLQLHNRTAFLEVQSAMARIGGSAVSVSWRSTPAELDYLVNNSGARAIFTDHECADSVVAARAHLVNVRDECLFVVGGTHSTLVPYEQAFVAASAIKKRPADSAEDGAVVIYTSGTTGKPKGAVRRFPKEMGAAVMRFLMETPIRVGDRHLAICPMYHSTAFGFIGFNFVVGGTLVIAPRFDPEQFLALVERERITTTAIVPTMIHRVLQLPERTLSRYDTSTLRGVFSGGAPLSGTLARRFIERFGPVLYNFYGATETGVNTLANSAELLRSPGTIGHLVPGNEFRILDDAGRAVPRGTTGELWVKNDMLVAGYHRNAKATDDSMREGFFSVGDLAHEDEHGLFHVDGRKRDMIISGGVNVYPAELEEVLHAHPAVAEAAVIGVPDEEWGERVRAFVALRHGSHATPADLLSHCRALLSSSKMPREIIVLDELPKNPTGKVLKRELRDWKVAPA
jgi:fatty-acyl-CoA synthase